MPLKSGRLTNQERGFAKIFAETANPGYSAAKAGYAHPLPRAHDALQRPAVQAEIVRIQTERLFNTILPLAVAMHEKLLADPKTPAGARVQAVKLAYDRTLGLTEGLGEKEPHEMTGDELQQAVTRLRNEAARRAKPVIEADDSDVMG